MSASGGKDVGEQSAELCGDSSPKLLFLDVCPSSVQNKMPIATPIKLEDIIT